jgi:hypothetical protein
MSVFALTITVMITASHAEDPKPHYQAGEEQDTKYQNGAANRVEGVDVDSHRTGVDGWPGMRGAVLRVGKPVLPAGEEGFDVQREAVGGGGGGNGGLD